MDDNYTIRLVLEGRQDATTEISVSGQGDLEHLISVFQLALSAVGIKLNAISEDVALH